MLKSTGDHGRLQQLGRIARAGGSDSEQIRRDFEAFAAKLPGDQRVVARDAFYQGMPFCLSPEIADWAQRQLDSIAWKKEDRVRGGDVRDGQDATRALEGLVRRHPGNPSLSSALAIARRFAEEAIRHQALHILDL